MPTMRRYRISLDEASISKHDPSSYLVKLDLTRTSPRREITVARLAEALAEADAFAKEHGKACHISIRCLDRKPPGFDAATGYHTLFRNMETAAAT